MKTCFRCKSTKLARAFEEESWTWPLSRGAKATVTIEHVPTIRCGSCGETYTPAGSLKQAERIAGAELIRMGVRGGKFLRWIRAGQGLTGAELAKLFGVTPETVSRWENDRFKPGPAVWNALADLVEDSVHGRTTTRDRLQTPLAKTKKRVTLRFAAAAA